MPLHLLVRTHLLSLTFVLGACATRSPEPESASQQQVRFLSQLPSSAQCQLLDTIEVLEGNNCNAAGINQGGQENLLRYNVTQKARKRGANIVIADPVVAQSWAGCPNSGLSMQAKLYRCSYAN
jgi:hypothetical protein